MSLNLRLKGWEGASWPCSEQREERVPVEETMYVNAREARTLGRWRNCMEAGGLELSGRGRSQEGKPAEKAEQAVQGFAGRSSDLDYDESSGKSLKGIKQEDNSI